MAKTDVQKLQDALARGDLEAAKTLAAKLGKAAAAPKPKPKSALILPPRPAAAEAEAEAEFAGLPEYDGAAEDPRDRGEYNPATASWLAPVRRADRSQPGRTKVFEDGKARQEMRRESMKGQGLANTFTDTGRGGIDARFKKANTASQADRPAGENRRPTHKVKVRCEGCGKPFAIYPSEMVTIFHEDLSSERVYKCINCIKRGK